MSKTLIKEHKRQKAYRHTRLLTQLNDLIEHLIDHRKEICWSLECGGGNIHQYVPKELIRGVHWGHLEETFMDCVHDDRVPTIKEITDSVLGGIIS